MGRLIDALHGLGGLDDTLVFCIGDNGASAEGLFHGTTNEVLMLNQLFDIETEDYLAAHIDDLGTPALLQPLRRRLGPCHEHPYQWTKQVASHWGGESRQRRGHRLYLAATHAAPWPAMGSSERWGVSRATGSRPGCDANKLIRTSRRCGRFVAS